MAIAMRENSAVLLPYPVPTSDRVLWLGSEVVKRQQTEPSEARRELDCGNGTGDSQRYRLLDLLSEAAGSRYVSSDCVHDGHWPR